MPKIENLQPNEDSTELSQGRDVRKHGQIILRGALVTAVATASLFAAHVKNSHASVGISREAEPALASQNIKPVSYEASPAQPVEAISTKKGTLFINNKPAFPFGVWSPSDRWGVDTLNANLLVDVNSPSLASSVVGSAWVLEQARPNTPIQTNFPNSIGNSWYDEPEEYLTPQQLQSTPHSKGVNFENFRLNISDEKLVNLSDDDVVLTTKDGRQITGKTYKQYVSNLGPNAIVTFDYYPVNADNLSFNDAVRYQFHRMVAARKLINSVNPNAVVGCYVETTNFNNSSASLSPNMVISQSKACITGGARIQLWWDRKGDQTPDSTSPEVAAAIREYTQKIHRPEVSSILLAENLKVPDSAWDSPLKMGGRVIKDKSGKPIEYGIILQNATDKSIFINEQLPGLKNQTVTNVWNGTVGKASNGRIHATIPPGDWIIATYRP